MKLFIAIMLLALAASGCVTRSKARAEAQTAYAAGERAAYTRVAALQRTSVFVIGPVQKPDVTWTNGLTLAQAIVAADYTGHHNPGKITLIRQGEQAAINPADLLNGHDIPLQPGDTITIQE